MVLKYQENIKFPPGAPTKKNSAGMTSHIVVTGALNVGVACVHDCRRRSHLFSVVGSKYSITPVYSLRGFHYQISDVLPHSDTCLYKPAASRFMLRTYTS